LRTPENVNSTVNLVTRPSMHITSNTMDAINWTVTLGWAHQFYLSLTDADGRSWMTGPLHSGGNGPTDCLVLGGNNLGLTAKVGSQGGGISSKVVIGSTIGAVVFGTLLGFLGSLCWSRKKRPAEPLEKGKEKDAGAVSSPRGSRFAVEPYPLPSQSEPQSQSPEMAGASMSRSTSPNSTMHPGRGEMTRHTSDGSSRQVYVVHHDGGRPPISVYHPEGANVVELPPSYGPRTPVEPQAGQDSLAQRMDNSPKGHKHQASGNQS